MCYTVVYFLNICTWYGISGLYLIIHFMCSSVCIYHHHVLAGVYYLQLGFQIKIVFGAKQSKNVKPFKYAG